MSLHPVLDPSIASRAPWRCCALLSALALAACSTLTPQVFSERLAPPAASDPSQRTAQPEALKGGLNGMIQVEDALAEAQRVQRQYVSAVKDLSEVGAGSSAALIGLSALALFKGVTHPTSADLAGLGVAGSATYAYASTMTSKPRQLLYLAGAEALNCAVAATRPYALPAGFLQAAEPPSGKDAALVPDDSLQGLQAQAAGVVAKLDSALQALRPFAKNQTRKERVGKPPATDCKTQPDDVCVAADARDGIDRKRQAALCQARVARRQAACAEPVFKDRVYTPNPEVAPKLRRLQAQQRHMARLISTASQQFAVFSAAGNGLWEHTVSVQLKVAAEVLRTEPDLAAVLSATQGMRSTAFSISKAPSLDAVASAASAASGVGTGQVVKAESDNSKALRGPDAKLPDVAQDRPGQQLDDADEAIVAAVQLADRLQAKLTLMLQRVRTAQTQLDRCSRSGGVATLSISPDVAEVELAPGASQTFTLRGATENLKVGKPTKGVLTRDLDGVGFTYTVNATAADGSTDTLHFEDGGRSRDVMIKIEKDLAAAPASTDISSLSPAALAALAAALNLSDKPPNDKAVMARIETCQKLVLKRPAADGRAIDPETWTAIVTGKCNG